MGINGCLYIQTIKCIFHSAVLTPTHLFRAQVLQRGKNFYHAHYFLCILFLFEIRFHVNVAEKIKAKKTTKQKEIRENLSWLQLPFMLIYFPLGQFYFFFLPLLQVSLLCFNSNKVLVLHIFYAVLCVYYKHINTIDTKAVANYCSDSQIFRCFNHEIYHFHIRQKVALKGHRVQNVKQNTRTALIAA